MADQDVTPAGRPVGRPRKLIADEDTLKIVAGLGKIQATAKECAAVLGVHVLTWYAFLKEHETAKHAFEVGKGTALASLRRSQFQMAERNVTMSIWLGKQYLDQKDKQEVAQTIDVQVTDARERFIDLINSEIAAVDQNEGDPEDSTTH